MFRKIPLLRLCSLTALSLAAMVAAAPSALAACSCMCVDATPYHVCTGFVTTQTQTPECDAMQCPSVEEPAPEPEPDPVEEPVATIDPPHPGLECERRSVYRPDLGRYKKYKVCKPSAKERDRHAKHHEKHHEKHGDKHHDKHRNKRHRKHDRNSEAWTARNERIKARWEAKMAQHRAKHTGYDEDDD